MHYTHTDVAYVLPMAQTTLVVKRFGCASQNGALTYPPETLSSESLQNNSDSQFPPQA
jgi:hypothetical protein